MFGEEAALGPGKADLLAFIAEEGSIAAACRRMGMSYKRAWLLVEELNAAFRAPLVVGARGGPGGGGASLTPEGEAVLVAFRQLETRIAEDGGGEIAAIRALLREG